MPSRTYKALDGVDDYCPKSDAPHCQCRRALVLTDFPIKRFQVAVSKARNHTAVGKAQTVFHLKGVLR